MCKKKDTFLKPPCIVPRSETEWIELVKIGWNEIVGNKEKNIVEETIKIYDEDIDDKKWIDLYGGGKASGRIVEILLDEGT